jgi:hypothetical protein
MKRTHLIAALVGLAAIAASSSTAHARYYQTGMNLYPGIPTPMPPMAGGFGAPHVGVNVYPGVSTPMPHPDGPNLYQYVRSNPVRFLDPTGTISYENCDNWCCYGKKINKDMIDEAAQWAHRRSLFMQQQFIAYLKATNDRGDAANAVYYTRVLKRLDCIEKYLQDPKIKCGSVWCSENVLAHIVPFSKTIRLCCPWTEAEAIDKQGTILHEAAHICGAWDPSANLRDVKPTDDPWLRDYDNTEAYEWWAEHDTSDW